MQVLSLSFHDYCRGQGAACLLFPAPVFLFVGVKIKYNGPMVILVRVRVGKNFQKGEARLDLPLHRQAPGSEFCVSVGQILCVGCTPRSAKTCWSDASVAPCTQPVSWWPELKWAWVGSVFSSLPLTFLGRSPVISE